MLSVNDVLVHLAEGIRGYTGADTTAITDEFFAGCTFDFNLAVTTDVEETKLDFDDRYGSGHAFHFKVADYEHARLLAGQMYWIFFGHRPDMTPYTGEKFNPEDKLYLFVHVTNIQT